MKTFLLDVLTPEDEEMVITILEGLRKGNAIAFHSVEPELTTEALHNQIRTSLASPAVSWEAGLAQLGL